MLDPFDPNLNPIDPMLGLGPRHFSPKQGNELSRDLKDEAEHLYANIAFHSALPFEQKKSFEYLSTIMVLAESDLLKEAEIENAYRDIIDLKEALYGGEISYSDPNFKDHLQQIVQKATVENPRAKLLSLSMELEHLLVLHVPDQSFAIDKGECKRLLLPIREKTYDPALSSLHLTQLFKQIEEIKDKLTSFPEDRHLHLGLLADILSTS